MNKIIIWGGDDFNTLGLLRQLHDQDVLFLVKGSLSCASKSKYCRNIYRVKDNMQALDFLMANRDEQHKPIIITSGDGISIFIDKHKSELEKYFIVPGTQQSGILEYFTDKNTMTALAKSIGFLCPASRFIKWDSPITEVKYPCLIKPSHEIGGDYNEFKFKICKSKSQLISILKKVRKTSEFILQDYIDKDYDVLIYGSRMWDNKTVIAGAFLKDRQAACGSGSHGLITSDIPACISIENIRIFLERIDYHGLFSFEFGVKDDKAFFFEVNLRNDGTSHYFYQAGANLPLAYVHSCLGREYNSIPTTVQKDAWFIDELFDIENIIQFKLNIKKWRKDLTAASIYKYFDILDPLPWKYMRRRWLTKIFKDLLLKHFRIYIVKIISNLGLKK